MQDFPDELSLETIKFLLDQLLKKQLKQMDEDGADIKQLHGIIIGSLESALLESVVHHCDGNKLKAARILGINRNTLHSKLKKYSQ